MHVARNKRAYVAKSGEQRVYESVLVRRTYREAGKVRHETLANLSALPAETVAAVEATLKGERLVPAGQAVTITGSVPHGHAAAVHAMAAKLGLPALLGPAGRARDLALALVISRVIRPGSKLSTLAWWGDTTLGADLGVEQASTDDIYAAMDWLVHRQDAIEAGLAAATWPRRPTRPDGAVRPVVLVAGRLAVPAGRPRLLPGRQERHAADRVRAAHRPSRAPGRGPRLPRQHRRPGRLHRDRQVVRDKFALEKMVMVGDRGMITSARIKALNQPERTGHPAGPLRVDHRAARPAIKKLMADDGPLQLSLFDQQDLAEITSPDFPGERLIACRNPVLAERSRPQARRPAGRHRETPGPAHRPGAGRAAVRRREDRGRGRQGDQQVQDRQALRRHDHR